MYSSFDEKFQISGRAVGFAANDVVVYTTLDKEPTFLFVDGKNVYLRANKNYSEDLLSWIVKINS